MNDLSALRKRIQMQRAHLSPTAQADAAHDFLQRLQQSRFVDAAQSIGVYLAHRGELNLQPTIDALWQQGKTLYLPSLEQDQLLFKKYTPHSLLHPNRFGILEVTEGALIAAENLAAVLVPLLAFDQNNHRIGMGKGYYDRSFAFRRLTPAEPPLLIGCAYAFQEIPLFTPAAHDVTMDVICKA